MFVERLNFSHVARSEPNRIMGPCYSRRTYRFYDPFRERIVEKVVKYKFSHPIRWRKYIELCAVRIFYGQTLFARRFSRRFTANANNSFVRCVRDCCASLNLFLNTFSLLYVRKIMIESYFEFDLNVQNFLCNKFSQLIYNRRKYGPWIIFLFLNIKICMVD